MKLILLRHGETPWNRERRLQGCKDLPLTQEGEAQIYNTGIRLAQSGLQIDQIVASPLQRTFKTAQIVAEVLKYPLENIGKDGDLVERGLGVCEGMLIEEAKEKYPDRLYPGMEMLDALCCRVEKVIERCEKAYPDQTVLLVSHGGTIRAMMQVLTQGIIPYASEDAWLENGNLCLAEKQDNSWKIIYKE